MKRRNFLKLVAAAVICPKGLLTEKKKPWTEYHKNHNLSNTEKQKLIEKMREAFNNTKFKSPIFLKSRQMGSTYGIPYYFRGVLNA